MGWVLVWPDFEFAGLRIKSFHTPCVNLIHPALDGEVIAAKPPDDRRMSLQAFHLREHVELCQTGNSLGIGRLFKPVVEKCKRIPPERKPAANRRNPAELFRMQDRLDGAAIRVAADDNAWDFELDQSRTQCSWRLRRGSRRYRLEP